MERRIRRFTPKARSILNVVPSDVGRPLDDIKPNVDVPDLDAPDRRGDRDERPCASRRSRIATDAGTGCRSARTRGRDNEIDGATLSLVDIDALKHHVARPRAPRRRPSARTARRTSSWRSLSHELRTPLSTHADAGAAPPPGRSTTPRPGAPARRSSAARRCRSSSSTISSTSRASSPASSGWRCSRSTCRGSSTRRSRACARRARRSRSSSSWPSTIPIGTGLRRSDAPPAGRVEPAHQRDQVHAPGRAGDREASKPSTAERSSG